jgi:2-phosphoglycerate kinase
VREMIKTAVENKQNLIVEGCYIPFNWAEDFEKEYLEQIRCYCLVMTEKYIRNHFEQIKQYANVIECRLDDSDCTLQSVLEDNARSAQLAKKYKVNCITIDDRYPSDLCPI